MPRPFPDPRRDLPAGLLPACWLAAAGLALPAGASTGQAWEQAAQDVRAACIEASGLQQARLVSGQAIFDDTVAQTAVLVRGKAPQAHMSGAVQQMLCLYDRRSKQARTVEWQPFAPSSR